MSDILILMRHGKAQRPAEDMLDIERRLTVAGKRSLAATLPRSLAMLPDDGARIEVWSSPAARAEQTARIAHRACRGLGANVSDDLKLVDALWSQDRDAFLEGVRACGADVVLAVGHNPFIEDVTAFLTGSRIDFATGAMAAVSLDGAPAGDAAASGATGRLLWFSQGPVSQKWKTLVQMERILGDAADTVQNRLDAFLAEPGDIETMHKFRVSIRTLRSLTAFVEPWQAHGQNKRVQADLKGIVASTSRQRELDVLAQQACDMEGGSAECAEYCLNAAADERALVMKELSSKRTAKKLEQVSSQLHDVKWRASVEADGLDARCIRARFDELASSLEADLAALDLSDADKTHDVRKNAKRVRYDAEQFSALIGEDAVDIAKGMEKHQDNLGAICDARVNIGILNELESEDLPESVAWDLALLRAQNETFLYSTLRNR